MSKISNSGDNGPIPSDDWFTHVVWDWNGTLVDDLGATIAAANAAIQELGARLSLSPARYGEEFGHPVRDFYGRIVGRSLTDEEWLRASAAFEWTYSHLDHQLDLVRDARVVLNAFAENGTKQSILSMCPQARLETQVRRFGLSSYFLLLDGDTEIGPVSKSRRLGPHIDVLGGTPSTTVVVGDSCEEARAAQGVGAACIVVGPSRISPSAQARCWVVDSLSEVLDLVHLLAP